ncbi:ring-infected erythrocyte surface antigen domain-containing protein [Staphylococcus epidermidis]|uniref:hypothetical protein n=1 Tax=Staphylococcus epidermidis TaxID=1282 RepID=UPI0011A36457|nr:hypothetical protein [Staphylococcus epidermidis]
MNQWVNYLMLNETDADSKLSNIKEPTQQEIAKILSQNSDLFQATWLGNFFKVIGWLVTWIFYWITQMMRNTLENIFTLGGLLDNKQVTELSSTLTPVALSIMLVTLGALGLMMMTGKRIQISNVFVNIILAVCFITMIPYMFSTLTNLTVQFVHDQKHISIDKNKDKENKKMDLPSKVVKANVIDLADFANKDFPSRKNNENSKFNHLDIPTDSKSIFDSFDYSEKIKPFYQGEDDDKIGYHDRLKLESKSSKIKTPNDLLDDSLFKKIVHYGQTKTEKQKNDIVRNGVFAYALDNDLGGKYKSEKDKDPIYSRMAPSEDSGAFKSGAGILKFFDEYPLRYQTNFLVLWLSLGGLAIVYLFSAFKVVKLIFDIAFQKVLAPFVAATDLTTGQKMKSLFNNIILNYAVIGIIFILFLIYEILVSTVMGSDAGFGVKAIAFIALSIACIDGPDTAKRVLGIDTGVQDGKAAALATYGAGKGIGKASTAGAKGVSNLYNSMSGGKKVDAPTNNMSSSNDSKSFGGGSELEPTDMSKHDVNENNSKADQFSDGQSNQNNQENIDDISSENQQDNDDILGDQHYSDDDSAKQDVDNIAENQDDLENANGDNNLENRDEQPSISDSNHAENQLDNNEHLDMNEDNKEMNDLDNDEQAGINDRNEESSNDLENNEQQGIGDENETSNNLDNTEQLDVNEDNKEVTDLDNNEQPGIENDTENYNSPISNENQEAISNDGITSGEDVPDKVSAPSENNTNNISDNINSPNTNDIKATTENVSSENNTNNLGKGIMTGTALRGLGEKVGVQSGVRNSANAQNSRPMKSLSDIDKGRPQGQSGLSYSEAKSNARNNRPSTSYPKSNGLNKTIPSKATTPPKASAQSSNLNMTSTPSNSSVSTSNNGQEKLRDRPSSINSHSYNSYPKGNHFNKNTPPTKQVLSMKKPTSSMKGTHEKVTVPRTKSSTIDTANRRSGLSYSQAKANANTLNKKTPRAEVVQSSGNIKRPNPNSVSSRASRPQYMAQEAPSMDKANEQLDNNSKK